MDVGWVQGMRAVGVRAGRPYQPVQIKDSSKSQLAPGRAHQAGGGSTLRRLSLQPTAGWPSAPRLVQAVPFSEVVLEALARPEPAVAENSLDYFLMLNTGANWMEGLCSIGRQIVPK